MFDDGLRELRRLKRGVKITISLPDDADGYLDRLCQHVECKAEFKVFSDDWSGKVADEKVYCPLCRHEAESGEWNTPKQQKYIEEVGKAELQKQLNNAFRSDSRKFNSRQPRGGLIQMSMSYQPDRIRVPIPADAADAMRLKASCEECGCRYSSVGAAFFCPACGHNSAISTFDNALETVRVTLGSIPAIRKAVSEAVSEDAAQDTIRQTLESTLVKIIASFQRFAEARFHALPNANKFRVRRNLFQNLPDSNQIWHDATGTGYDSILSVQEYSELTVCFQQRHLLAHQEGIVDQQYIDRSGDHAYSIGQRLVIRDSAVDRLSDLIAKLSAGLPV